MNFLGFLEKVIIVKIFLAQDGLTGEDCERDESFLWIVYDYERVIRFLENLLLRSIALLLNFMDFQWISRKANFSLFMDRL